MRLALRLMRGSYAPNQNIVSPKLWQDPVFGYFETHGKTEFVPGEEYNLTDEEKKAVLWRYRVKEILKKEYLRREFDPNNFKYKEGVTIDAGMFRWYASEMTQAEFFRVTPKSFFLYVGSVILFFYLGVRICTVPSEKAKQAARDGRILWWDRNPGREATTGGSGPWAVSMVPV